jgi:hypothetical protein
LQVCQVLPKVASSQNQQLAMIGEGGQSEAVIPLDKLGKMGGGDIIINVTGGLATSAEIGESVVNALRAYSRSAGPLQLQVA